MGMDTNDLDTRDEDKARTEGRLAEFWEEEKEEEEKVDKYSVEYFINNEWKFYSGPHKNIDSAICNASVVSGCRHTNARITLEGKVLDEGNADHWESKLKEKAD